MCHRVVWYVRTNVLEEPTAYRSRASKLEAGFFLETLVYVWQATGQHVAKNWRFKEKLTTVYMNLRNDMGNEVM